MSFCTITPSRGGERKEFFEFCVKQLVRLTGGKNNYLMNDHPINNEVDLVPRIRQGIASAKEDGFTHVFIVEDDDSYKVEYFQNDLNFDFFGYSDSTYYHLKNKSYQKFSHPKRSSLFTTAFKISALDKFKWPANNHVFLDISLWEFATKNRFKVRLLKENPCLGIKHGIGLTGGKGHRMNFRNKDNDLKFLRSRTDEESFEFYTDLMRTL